jgi:hypothetical protein
MGGKNQTCYQTLMTTDVLTTEAALSVSDRPSTIYIQYGVCTTPLATSYNLLTPSLMQKRGVVAGNVLTVIDKPN